MESVETWDENARVADNDDDAAIDEAARDEAASSITIAANESRHTHIAEHFGQLLWVFTIMSVIGLFGETLQHYIAFGEWESRMGFIWGPFSPIYGLAAVLFTITLEPLQDRAVPVPLIVAAVVGGSLEYFASWAMETYWGVVAWSYQDQPLNINGRTDVFHSLVWGTLGTLWVKIGLPICQLAFDRVHTDGRAYRITTAALAVFMRRISWSPAPCCCAPTRAPTTCRRKTRSSRSTTRSTPPTTCKRASTTWEAWGCSAPAPAAFLYPAMKRYPGYGTFPNRP